MKLPPPWSAEMLAIITENIGATVSVYDRDLVFRYVSASFARFFGLRPEQMIGRTLPECYGEDVFMGYWPKIERALAGEPQFYERLLIAPTGERSWRTVSLNPIRDAHGAVIGVVNAAHNVHELKTTSEALHEANQRLLGHMHNSPLALVEFDGDLRLIAWSPRAVEMFGHERDALTDDVFATVCPDEDCAAQLRSALAQLERGEVARNRVEAIHRRADGSRLYCEWFNSALRDTRGRLLSIMCLVEDVSSRVQAQEQLRFIAEHDSLTGLPNRAALHARVERALARARRSAEQVALLFIDLDGFKAINDTWGHGAGDEALRQTAQRLLRAVRETDTVARLGGDEYVVLLEGQVAPETPIEVSQRILETMSLPFQFATARGQPSAPRVVQARLGASIGIAAYPAIDENAEGLFKRADEAMYAAKRAGKGCVRVAANIV